MYQLCVCAAEEKKSRGVNRRDTALDDCEACPGVGGTLSLEGCLNIYPLLPTTVQNGELMSWSGFFSMSEGT